MLTLYELEQCGQTNFVKNQVETRAYLAFYLQVCTDDLLSRITFYTLFNNWTINIYWVDINAYKLIPTYLHVIVHLNVLTVLLDKMLLFSVLCISLMLQGKAISVISLLVKINIFGLQIL